MIDSRPQHPFGTSPGRVATLLGAGLLLLLGIVFQLAQFGYDGFAVRNFWFLSMIAENVWNFQAARSYLPALAELVRFWPMLLVAGGLALFALPCSERASRPSASQVRIANRD